MPHLESILQQQQQQQQQQQKEDSSINAEKMEHLYTVGENHYGYPRMQYRGLERWLSS